MGSPVMPPPEIQLLAVATADGVEVWYPSQPAQDRPVSDTDYHCIAAWQPFTTVPKELASAKLVNKNPDVRCVAWSQDGQILAVGGLASWIELYTWQGDLVETFPIQKPAESPENLLVNAMEFASESRTVVYGGSTRQVRRWDRQAKCIAQTFQSHRTTITALALSVDKSLIASGSSRGEVILFNRKNGTKAELKFGTRHAITNLQFSTRRKHILAAISDDGAVAVWETHRAAVPVKLFSRVHTAPSRGLVFSPTSSYTLISAGLDQKIVVFDLQKRSVVDTIATSYPLNALAMSRDGNLLYAGTLTGQILIYNLRMTNRPLWISPPRDHSKPVVCIQYHADAKLDILQFTAQLKRLLPGREPVPSAANPMDRQDNGHTTSLDHHTPPETPPAYGSSPPATRAESPPNLVNQAPTGPARSRGTSPPSKPRPSSLVDRLRTLTTKDPPPEPAVIPAPATVDSEAGDTSMVARDRSFMQLFSPVGRPAVTRPATSPLKAAAVPSTCTPVLCSPSTDRVRRVSVGAADPRTALEALVQASPTLLPSRPSTDLEPVSTASVPPCETRVTPLSSGPPQPLTTPGKVTFAEPPVQALGDRSARDPSSTNYLEGDSILDAFSPVAPARTAVQSQVATHPPAIRTPTARRRSLNHKTPQSIRRSALKKGLKSPAASHQPVPPEPGLTTSPTPTARVTHHGDLTIAPPVAFPAPAPVTRACSPPSVQLAPPAHYPSHPPLKAADLSSPSTTELLSGPGLVPSSSTPAAPADSTFHLTLMQNLIDDSLANFRFGIHQELQNIHMELISQFHRQMMDQNARMEEFRKHQDLTSELARLREENRRLRLELGYQ
ncbi:hypothetical protein IWQ60_010093 [Tieghemiomyces parasiticus]|uniref:E3 ubiquitin-protein ligase RFWD3-like WD40 domain-containing protein n=1 Tax=Tieghemiomyces parasiticus TaxID=78921 RepID=A0A9W7ZKT9_9FUNG|nr:hypothetical protein IWQ60_010093 [Tieghemiomyces parasiticus]